MLTLAEFRELQEFGLIHSAPCGDCGRIDEICDQCLADIKATAALLAASPLGE